MIIVGANLMVLIIGGHFADKQLKKKPHGRGKRSTQVEADGMTCSRETIPPSATLRTCQKTQWGFRLIWLILLIWHYLSRDGGPGSYSECSVGWDHPWGGWVVQAGTGGRHRP